MNKPFLAIVLAHLTLLRVCAAERPSVAVLATCNASTDTNITYLEEIVGGSIYPRLCYAKAIRILPDSSVQFALHKLNLQSNELFDASQLQKVGETIDAKWVVWSKFDRDSKTGNWRLTTRIVNTASGQPQTDLVASSAEWSKIIIETAHGILRELSVNPTPDESELINHPVTSSEEVFELLGHALADNRNYGSSTAVEAKLRRCILLDPECTPAREDLAHILLLENELVDATDEAQKAIRLQTNSASSHDSSGTVYLFRNMPYLARTEFLEAVRLDPDSSRAYMNLSQAYLQQGRLEEARSNAEQAANLAPYSAVIHALLGSIYIRLQETEKARAELRLAEQYYLDNDSGVEMQLADAYDTLHDAPSAVEWYEKFLGHAKSAGVILPAIESDENRLAQLKASLTPHYIIVEAPREFTKEELENVLEAKLTRAQLKLVVNPLASTLEMDAWAKQLVAGATNQQQMARKLFDGLTRHVDLKQEDGGRAAVVAFQDWFDPGAWLTCSDYAFLYVALARSVGLKAYYVHVNKDYQGTLVDHACAGVMLNDKALLVDPAYQWFGVPHRDYQFLNDLQVAGMYVGQTADLVNLKTAHLKTALSIWPEQPQAKFALAVILTGQGALTEAREELDAGLKMDPKSASAFAARGMMEFLQQHWEPAIKYFRESLALRPDKYELHGLLGAALYRQGKLTDARDEYEAFMQRETNASNLKAMREAIKEIDRQLASKESSLTQHQSIMQAREFGAPVSEPGAFGNTNLQSLLQH